MITSILVFLIVLSILVLVHEFGHFIAARRAGILIEEFGFGLPPRLIGKKIGETIYSLNLFPFGGFVRLHGEDDPDSITQAGRAFLNKSKKVRAAIVVAGVLMNFLLSIVTFSIVYTFTGIPKESANVKIIDVKAGSPAQIAGILVGSYIREVEGITIKSLDDFVSEVEKSKGKKTKLVIEEKVGQEVTRREITITPREFPPENEGPLGVTITATEIYFPPIWQRPFYGIYYGFKESIFWGQTIVLGFVKIFKDLTLGILPKDVAGPIGIYAITSQAATLGALAVINFIGILSVNLAILNILPIPALDGGRLLFIAIESFFGRKVVPRVESALHTIGLVILVILLLLISAREIKIISSVGFSGYLENFVK